MQAVLFDMDGVLVDSEPHWKHYWTEEIFPTVNEGQPTLNDVTGRNFRESLELLDEKYGLPGGKEPLERETEVFADEMYRNGVTVTPGMPALFSRLDDRNLKLAIVSSSARRWIRHVLDQSDLNDPDVVVSAEDIEAAGKPSPAVYEHAASRLGIEPSSCIVVEDSKNGLKAASDAGATVIRYQCDHGTEPSSTGDYVADDLTELREQLFRLVGER